jgi:hypothetical protein
MAGETIAEKPIIESPKITPIKIEHLPNSENKAEQILPPTEQIKEIISKPIEKKGEDNIVAVSRVQDWQKQQAAAIDNILSEGLNEVFLKMNPDEQAVFKKTGEETVIKISKLLMETKVKVNKIVALIRKWLQLIPGVNKFFLEQEVKIKADKIMRIKNKF